jgi:hypothetical protein
MGGGASGVIILYYYCSKMDGDGREEYYYCMLAAGEVGRQQRCVDERRFGGATLRASVREGMWDSSLLGDFQCPSGTCARE